MTKVAFLGLGVMGYPMAGHLAKAGHSVTVYNRTTAKAEAWAKQHGGAVGKTPAEASKGAELVMACVGNDDDLRAVCLGDNGAFATMAKGSIFVDHTTVSAAVTRELYEAAKANGIAFVDAPVSGGQAGAENGQLSIMCGGDQADYDRAEPVMNVYAKLCRRIGDSGAGQMTKMCNQIAIAGTMIGVFEALTYAHAVGLDPETLLASIGAGAAGSWTLTNLYPRVLRGDFGPGFFAEHFLKDLRIARAEAQQRQLRLPGLALAESLYQTLIERGGAQLGTQAIYQVLSEPDA